jgi:hypothetical protein
MDDSKSRVGIRHRNMANDLKQVRGSQRRVFKPPRAAIVESIAPVAFPLTALIPEDAARKFAANKPFVVHVYDGVNESLILYLGHKLSF